MTAMKRATIGALVLALTVSGTVQRAARADYAAAEAILEGGTLGGVRGLRVRRIGAAQASFSKNGGFVYYPASSMKVLEHLYAMTLVDAGTWTLAGTSASVCTGADNCGPVLNAFAGCGAVSQPMNTVLSAMMKNSSNAATNAVQERVGLTHFPMVAPWSLNMAWGGRLVLNNFAANTLGMASSAINHKFGCQGFCGNPAPNRLTLIDVERLYTAIATDGALLSPATRQQLHDLMLNESGSFLDDVIDQEAAATGRNAWKEDFRDRVYQVYKSGSWTCSGKTFRSSSGLLQLPTHNGAYKRLYTWGAFTHDSEAWAYLDGTVGNAAKELLRPSIRAALLTWGFGYVPAQQIEETAGGLEQVARTQGGAAPLIEQAAGLLRDASRELEGHTRDYGAALALVRDAGDRLTAARRLAPGFAAAEPLRALAQAAAVAGDDVLALATTSGGSDRAPEAVGELHRRAAAAKRAGSDPAAALRTYAALALEGMRLVVASPSDTPFDDARIGFVGTASRDVTFSGGE